MCKGMNRSFFNVILGGFGATEDTSSSSNKEQRPVKSGMQMTQLFNEKRFVSDNVPGYGMAVAQAQHALREMVDTLKKNDIKVSCYSSSCWTNARTYECFISRSKRTYDEVFELEEINNDFANADVAFVIGANDVTNPVAKTILKVQFTVCPSLMLRNVSRYYL